MQNLVKVAASGQVRVYRAVVLYMMSEVKHPQCDLWRTGKIFVWSHKDTAKTREFEGCRCLKTLARRS